MKKLDNVNLKAVSNGVKVLGLIVAGIGYVISQRLEEQQLDERINNALDERGLVMYEDRPAL